MYAIGVLYSQRSDDARGGAAAAKRETGAGNVNRCGTFNSHHLHHPIHPLLSYSTYNTMCI